MLSVQSTSFYQKVALYWGFLGNKAIFLYPLSFNSRWGRCIQNKQYKYDTLFCQKKNLQKSIFLNGKFYGYY